MKPATLKQIEQSMSDRLITPNAVEFRESFANNFDDQQLMAQYFGIYAVPAVTEYIEICEGKMCWIFNMRQFKVSNKKMRLKQLKRVMIDSGKHRLGTKEIRIQDFETIKTMIQGKYTRMMYKVRNIQMKDILYLFVYRPGMHIEHWLKLVREQYSLRISDLMKLKPTEAVIVFPTYYDEWSEIMKDVTAKPEIIFKNYSYFCIYRSSDGNQFTKIKIKGIDAVLKLNELLKLYDLKDALIKINKEYPSSQYYDESEFEYVVHHEILGWIVDFNYLKSMDSKIKSRKRYENLVIRFTSSDLVFNNNEYHELVKLDNMLLMPELYKPLEPNRQDKNDPMEVYFEDE